MTLSIKSNSTTLQLVWKASTKVGFGVASDGNQKHVVARYSPRGNFGWAADYEANVLPAGSTGTDGGSDGGYGGECTEGALQHILELLIDQS